MPDGPFDLVLGRNVVATYYAPDVQRAIMTRIAGRLRPGGALVLGIHEALPEGLAGFVAWPGARAVYRRTGD
jgi:chemotaxis protein methyltransferase CheR